MAHEHFSGIALAAVLLATVFLPVSVSAGGGATLSQPIDLTDPGIPGQQTNPSSIVFNGLLYVFWASNSAETPIGNDFDITYATYDGHDWCKNIVLTPNDAGNDHTPQAIIFRGEMYLFWSSSNPNITGGTDADIVVRVFDGTAWSEPESLTSSMGSRGDYNPWPVVFNNRLYVFFEYFWPESNSYLIGCTFLDNDWEQMMSVTGVIQGHNLNPTAAVSGESLVLAWESYSDELAGDTRCSIISRTLDSHGWSEGFTSLSGDAGPSNADPSAASYGGAAWVFWSTDSEELSIGSDSDIVGRRFIAGSWADTTLEFAAVQDSGNDTGVSVSVHGGNLILSWISGSPEYSGGADTDVIMASFNGTVWSKPIDISRADGERNDGGGFTYRTPAMASYDDKLMIIWETNASPLLTVTANTWLAMVECDFSTENVGSYYLILVPIAVVVAVAAFLLVKRR
jgi:hypothetical protein